MRSLAVLPTRILLLLTTCLAAPALAQADHRHHGTHSPYAGLQERAIKSLSAEDVDQLRRGQGWGLALPAELNGVPGPAHLLELRERIPLAPDQVAQIQALFDAMKAAAIPVGERLIAAEAGLEDAFAAGGLDATSLRAHLAEAEAARTELRYIHLSQHLKAAALLSQAQIERYNALRGYTKSACDEVPAGHDPARHRAHLGCE